MVVALAIAGFRVGRGLALRSAAIRQQRPTHALERLVGALLDASHLANRRIGAPDDTDLVERDAGVQQMLGEASMKPR